MEKISEKEMLSILGGVHENCSDLVEEANNAIASGDPNFDWDAWAERFEATCGEGY